MSNRPPPLVWQIINLNFFTIPAIGCYANTNFIGVFMAMTSLPLLFIGFLLAAHAGVRCADHFAKGEGGAGADGGERGEKKGKSNKAEKGEGGKGEEGGEEQLVWGCGPFLEFLRDPSYILFTVVAVRSYHTTNKHEKHEHERNANNRFLASSKTLIFQ